jgi:hypothetical protein
MMSLFRLSAIVFVGLWLLGVCVSTVQQVASGVGFKEAVAIEQAEIGERAAACGEAISDSLDTMGQLSPGGRDWIADRMGANCLKLLVPF